LKALSTFAATTDKEVVEQFDMEYKTNWTRSFAFSDSVVRARPFDSEYNEGAFFNELHALVYAQADLANLGILIRGGVTVGDIYFDDGVLFGPALVASYDLESSQANYPRIVIDPAALNIFRNDRQLWADHHDLEDEIHYLKAILQRGDDGLWFIDYLGAIRIELEEPSVEYPAFLRRHKALILENGVTGSKSSRVMYKYLWLVNYHNAACKRLVDAELAAELKINKTDFEWLEEFPETSSDIEE
jgi:hypothetical protein